MSDVRTEKDIAKELAREGIGAVEAEVVKNLVGKGITVRQLLTFWRCYGTADDFSNTTSKRPRAPGEWRGCVDKRTETFKVVRDIIIPFTADSRSSFMDVVEGGHRKPKKLVSHWWGASFYGDLLCIMQDATGKSGWWLDMAISFMDFDQLEQELGPGVLNKAYWLCIFSVNQHISICGSSDNPCKCQTPKHPTGTPLCQMDKFHLVMREMEGLAVALDEHLTTLSRVWVISEIGTSLQMNKPISFYVPNKLSEELLLEPIVKAIRPVAECEATLPSDKDMILKQIGDQDFFDRSVREAALPVLLNTALLQVSESTPVELDHCLRSLLEQGANLNTANGLGETPIYATVCANNLPALTLLIEARADVNLAQTTTGCTPTYMAAQNGHVKALKLLLEARADVNLATTDHGCTPTFMAAQKGRHTKALKMLLEARADVNLATTDDGCTPTYMAAQKGHVEALKLLLEAGADSNKALETNGETNDGESPAFVAAELGNVDALNELLEARADALKARKDGVTPLHIAARNGHTATVKLLLKAQATPHSTDTDGKTPLSDAQNNGHDEVICMLKEAMARYPEQLQLIKQLVEAASKDADSIISRAEFCQLIWTLDPMFPEDQLAQLLASSDSDQDGKVRFGDFMDWVFNGSKVVLQRQV